MEFDLSKIEMSKRDINRGIQFPTRLTNELSEFIGIMIGDGHLGLYNKIDERGNSVVKSDIKISGNKAEGVYLKQITNLFYSLFNAKLHYKPDSASNAVLLTAHSKGIVQYLNQVCEIPVNRKTEIVKIPMIVKKAHKNIKFSFLRGLADTDFSVTFKNRTGKGHNYPVIKGAFKSKPLIKDLESLYSELGFRYCVVYDEKGFDKRFNIYDIKSCIYLNGKENFQKWVKKIGFSNQKFRRKIKKWKEDGVCPPGY